jgi:hypothetical protein
MVSRAVTTDDLPLVLVLDTRDGSGAGERWTVIAALEDTLTGEIAVHQSRWQNWLHWANVLQLIGGTGRDAVIAATSEGPDYPLDDLWLTGASPPPPDGTADPAASRAAPPEPAQALPDADLGTFYRATAPPAGLVAVSETMEEELDLVEDDQVRELARQALTQGAPELVSGYEHEGTPLEVAWPDLRVAVLLPDQVGFTTSGWDARPVGAWTAPDLISALKERT